MKILFLDVDGVINCCETRQRHRGFIGIDPFMSILVDRIVQATGCKVVLSSSWRHFPNGPEEVVRYVGELYGQTPTADSGFRGDEINMWLKEHPEVTRYAILDDGSDFHPGQPLFKTTWQEGITEDIKNAVIAYLNNESVEN